MQAPDRLTVPTCIGCGAMARFGTCETGCSEHKLELVRAGAYDSLVAVSSTSRALSDAFGPLAEKLAAQQPTANAYEAAYRSVQEDARAALRANQERDDHDVDWEEPAEPVTAWWCPACSGIDAPQPCLGICIWRPVEWVNRGRYQQERERAMAERERERCLRGLLRRIASITPHADHWQDSWTALQTDARRTLAAVQGRRLSCRAGAGGRAGGGSS